MPGRSEAHPAAPACSGLARHAAASGPVPLNSFARHPSRPWPGQPCLHVSLSSFPCYADSKSQQFGDISSFRVRPRVGLSNGGGKPGGVLTSICTSLSLLLHSTHCSSVQSVDVTILLQLHSLVVLFLPSQHSQPILILIL